MNLGNIGVTLNRMQPLRLSVLHVFTFGIAWISHPFSTASQTHDVTTVNKTTYETYMVDPSRVDLYWSDPAGRPFRQLGALHRHLGAAGRRVRFMMNAGIFEQGGIPSGLCLIEGKTLRHLNTAEGIGNFYLQPNGVFYIGDQGARVVPTAQFAEMQAPVRLAIQSGPLLVHDGAIHPKFDPQSKSRLHRNGVGVLPDGRVLFAITKFGQERYPNLHEFADFFRSQGCREALFLDGDLSVMDVDPAAAPAIANRFGAIFVVSDPP